MFLDKKSLKKVVGGSPANGGTSPDLPPREVQATQQQKVESASTDPTKPVEPAKP
ncbi:hypothetical protein [Pseudoalteromonas phenolica]|uniref:hypothetical protein n=1 Tax=Pseudoalteromonas phenolica TaxID=161398 RepID=UPI00148719AF|nr:hypothetical protein [Pseudoalteromonas phenolica]